LSRNFCKVFEIFQDKVKYFKYFFGWASLKRHMRWASLQGQQGRVNENAVWWKLLHLHGSSDGFPPQLSHIIRFVIVNDPPYIFSWYSIRRCQQSCLKFVNNPSFNFWFGYSSLTVFDLIVWTFLFCDNVASPIYGAGGFKPEFDTSILVWNRFFFRFWFLNSILLILVRKCLSYNSTEFQTSRKEEAK